MHNSKAGIRRSWLGVIASLGLALVGPSSASAQDADARLAIHTAEFKKEVIEVTDGVHVAIGFGLANSILIEGEDGVIIVDTMESVEAAGPVRKAFRKITDKPVKAIIYTHNHADHIFGATVMAGDDNPEVYSHATTVEYINRILNIIRTVIFQRSMRQFGSLLPETEVINCGIGPRLQVTDETTPGLIRPTITFDTPRASYEVAGIKFDLVFAPGETPDQIFVWLPEKKVLLPGDNFYKSFPNLYAIRGTSYRDVMLWANSLDLMRAERPEFLVPSHTHPLIGAETIETALRDYRDAIQYVHDQTIRGMNQGLTPDELAHEIKLPAHLSEKPYLQEYYGTVPWSVRAIFSGYLGWFDGNATNLSPLAPAEHARRVAALAGSEKKLLKQAKKALKGGDFQWATELADQVILVSDDSEKEANKLAEAKQIRVEALRALGELQTSANGRNYYLTSAAETSGELTIAQSTQASVEIVQSFPLSNIMKALRVNLNPVKSAEVDKIVGFRFPDTGEAYTVHVRRGVAVIRPEYPENADINVTVDAALWKLILAQMKSPFEAANEGTLKVEEGAGELINFLTLFQR